MEDNKARNKYYAYAEFEGVTLEYEGHISKDVVASAEEILREASMPRWKHLAQWVCQKTNATMENIGSQHAQDSSGNPIPNRYPSTILLG